MFTEDDFNVAVGKVHPAAVTLFLLLRSHDCGGGAWPSMQTLADRMGVARSTVYRLREELTKAGLVRVEQRTTATGQPDSSFYIFPHTPTVLERDGASALMGTVSKRDAKVVLTSTEEEIPSSLPLDRDELRGSLFGSAEKRETPPVVSREKTEAPGPPVASEGESPASRPAQKANSAVDLDRPRHGMARLARRETEAVAIVDTYERDRKAQMTRPRDLSARKRANALVSARVLLGEHRYQDVLALLSWAIEHHMHEGWELSALRTNWDEWSAELRFGKVRTVADVLAGAPGRPPPAVEIETWVREHSLHRSCGVPSSTRGIVNGCR